MRIEPITAEMAEKYREQIAQFYFDNVRSNACHSHYTYEEAYEKINDLGKPHYNNKYQGNRKEKPNA